MRSSQVAGVAHLRKRSTGSALDDDACFVRRLNCSFEHAIKSSGDNLLPSPAFSLSFRFKNIAGVAQDASGVRPWHLLDFYLARRWGFVTAIDAVSFSASVFTDARPRCGSGRVFRSGQRQFRGGGR